MSAHLPATSSRLFDAMRYACLGGGKRFRAVLVYACGEIAGAKPAQLDALAAAVEMVHAYSLIHDDLPAMDDDDLRRGRASCHIAFDEATAILAGDALQTRAFEIIAGDIKLNVSAERRLKMIETLARAIGGDGMAGGQALDIAAGGATHVYDEKNLTELQQIHALKTGALIRAAAKLGALASPKIDDAILNQIDQYATHLGLAFQVVDDILDETAGDEFGKRGGGDRRMKKVTYVSVLGVDGARDEAQKLAQNALDNAASLGDNSAFLRHLAHFVVNRNF